MPSPAISNPAAGRELGRSGTSRREAVALIRSGVSAAVVARFAETMELPKARVFELLGISERNIPRRVAEGTLKPIESDRFYRLARALALAEEAIGDAAKARAWLKRPNRALGGETPFDFLDTEAGAQEVENVLQQIKHGVFA